jgi:hypothetical protein
MFTAGGEVEFKIELFTDGDEEGDEADIKLLLPILFITN